MTRQFSPQKTASRWGDRNGIQPARCSAAGFVLAAFLSAGALTAQVITIDTTGKGPVAGSGAVEHQYQQITPTHVDLPKEPLDPRARLMLIRSIESEQGFAMRPFPRGHKGLTLAANGNLAPAGVAYLNMVVDNGLSAKPGQRLTITNIRVDRSKIILDLNGGPDAKHRFMRHIQIGVGPMDSDEDPSMLDQSGDPAGARLTLSFPDTVPELTAQQVKALLAPMISFDVKTPVQAFTDTLPPALREAILNHDAWVGMSLDMLMFAKGQPRVKSHEMQGQMPVDIWMYGTPPDPVTFVRINGNRVIRVEIAKVGQPVEVFTKDEVTPLLMASGSPELASGPKVRVVGEGDVKIDPDKRAPAAPPSLRAPGEKLPTDNQDTGAMRPVQMPKPRPDDTPGTNPDEQQQPVAAPANSQGSQPGNAPPSQTTPQSPASGSKQPAPAQTPPDNASQQPPANSSQFVPSGSAI